MGGNGNVSDFLTLAEFLLELNRFNIGAQNLYMNKNRAPISSRVEFRRNYVGGNGNDFFRFLAHILPSSIIHLSIPRME